MLGVDCRVLDSSAFQAYKNVVLGFNEAWYSVSFSDPEFISVRSIYLYSQLVRQDRKSVGFWQEAVHTYIPRSSGPGEQTLSRLFSAIKLALTDLSDATIQPNPNGFHWIVW